MFQWSLVILVFGIYIYIYGIKKSKINKKIQHILRILKIPLENKLTNDAEVVIKGNLPRNKFIYNLVPRPHGWKCQRMYAGLFLVMN